MRPKENFNKSLIPKILAVFLAAANLFLLIGLPLTLHAQLGAPELDVPAAVSQLEGSLAGSGFGPLNVPVNQCTLPGFCSAGTAILASGIATTKLSVKSTADFLATVTIKRAIGLLRDIVIRWIITGRFQKPVFSASFTADLAKVAENASRIYLSGLTNIDFCETIGAPSLDAFNLSLNFGLSCTLPTQADINYADYILTGSYNPQQLDDQGSFTDRFKLFNAENNKIYTFVEITRQRDEAIARSIASYNAEYAAGRGFLGIRDAQGRVTTPGSYVAELAMDSLIRGPREEFSTANTIQQALAAIVDTFIQVNVNKGLNAVFNSSNESGGGGGISAPTIAEIKAGVQSAISRATTRASNFLTKPEVTEAERSRINESLGLLSEYSTQLAATVSETRVTVISNQVSFLDLQIRNIVTASRFCSVTNPRDAVCLP